MPLPAPLGVLPVAADLERREHALPTRADPLTATLRGDHVTGVNNDVQEERGLDEGRSVAHVARRQNADVMNVNARHEEPPLLAATERTVAMNYYSILYIKSQSSFLLHIHVAEDTDTVCCRRVRLKKSTNTLANALLPLCAKWISDKKMRCCMVCLLHRTAIVGNFFER